MKIQKFTCLILTLLATAYSVHAQTGRVGIGTTTPRAGLDVDHDDGIIATGALEIGGNTSDIPSGEGARLLWIPRLGAFRAGYVNASQ